MIVMAVSARSRDGADSQSAAPGANRSQRELVRLRGPGSPSRARPVCYKRSYRRWPVGFQEGERHGCFRADPLACGREVAAGRTPHRPQPLAPGHPARPPVGDAHFAQGDGEICGTAIEMQSVFHARFFLRKGEAARRNQRDVAYFRDTYARPPELAVPRRFYATTGLSIEKGGLTHVDDPAEQLIQHERPLLFFGPHPDLLHFHWVTESAHGSGVSNSAHTHRAATPNLPAPPVP